MHCYQANLIKFSRIVSALSSVKMKHFYLFYILIVIGISCNSAPDFKNYGVLSSEMVENPTIDTSNNIVRPVTLKERLYHLTNKSTNHNIDFVCKAYLKGNGDVLLEKTERHIVAPQETINLNVDSNSNDRVLKFEIVEAHTVNE
jgi:hypothetical protein